MNKRCHGIVPYQRRLSQMQQDNIDAFTGGVRPDGLKKKSDIKVLVCFLLRHCTQQLSRKEMTDIFLDKGLANYFEVSDAISSLVRHENIIENIIEQRDK